MQAVHHYADTLANVARPSGRNRHWRAWRKALAWSTVCIVLPLWLAACGGSDGSPPAIAVTATIDAAGGTLVGPDGVQLVVPEGALTSATQFSILRNDAAAPPLGGVRPISGIYEVTPHGTEFAVSARIHIPYDHALVPPGARAIMIRAQPGGNWSMLDAGDEGVAALGGDTPGLSFYAVGTCYTSALANVPGPDPLVACPAAHSLKVEIRDSFGAAIPVVRNTNGVAQPVMTITTPTRLRVGVVYVRPPSGRQDYLSLRARGVPSPADWPLSLGFGTLTNNEAGLSTERNIDLVPASVSGATQPGGVVVRFHASVTTEFDAFYPGCVCFKKASWTYEAEIPVRVIETPAPIVTFTVGGSVSGLTASGLVLRNNGGDSLTVAPNASVFTFANAITSGAAYAVTVQTQPSGQNCTVQSGTGNANADVTNVAVTCVTPPAGPFTISGAVSGLTGSGLVLQNNGGDNLAVAADGAFNFATAVTSGAAYAVTVQAQPSGQICTATNGSGTANANITNVTVSCAASLGSSFINGYADSNNNGPVVLQNNGTDNITVSADSFFNFATKIADGAPYNVTVLTPPAGQICTVQNATGTAPQTTGKKVNVVCVDLSTGSLALVANSGSVNGANGLSVYQVNASTGALSHLNDVSTGKSPYAVAVTPNGLFAYVSNQLGDSVSAYGVDNATGVLTPLTGRVSNNASGLAMDRLGRYLWVANYGWQTLSGFAIAADGTLTPVPGSPLNSTYTLPYVITAHPTMDFVYVAYQSSSMPVSVYSVDSATGALTLRQTLTYAISAPSGIVIDPSGRFAYAISQSGGISAFAINPSTGLLTTIGSLTTNGAAFAVVVHPNGQYVYVTSGTSSNNLEVFAINQTTGALTRVVASYSAGNNPRGVTVNAAGTYLYVTNYVSNDVSAFSISGGGATLISLGAAVPAGSTPQGIAIAP